MKLSELINFQSNKNRLCAIKRHRRDIIPFVGAGVSKSCGLYTWRELLEILANDYFTKGEISKAKKENSVFEFADMIVNAAGNSDMIMRRIREIFGELDISPNEIPYLLVTQFSPMIVTTNYDNLMETASSYSPNGPLKPLLPCLVSQMNETIQVNDRCLLKLHGSLEEISSFVFTSQQYKVFYGSAGNRENKLLPMYLNKIFTSKKVLFVGCSLDKDYTLEILEECVQQNSSLSHYAILPYPTSKNKQIIRNRELSRLGIEPIYYPEGDYSAVNKLISYLSEENRFIRSLKNILIKCLVNTEITEEQVLLVLSLINESFYATALEFPELLDIDAVKDDYTEDILSYIGTSRRQDDTIMGICKNAFCAYVRAGYLHYENETIDCFNKQFEDRVLKESDIISLLQKRWSIDRSLLDMMTNNQSWVTDLSEDEINNYANYLIQHLAYSNGMSFSGIPDLYNKAKYFYSCASDRLEFHTKLLLLNALGAIGTYCSDSAGATKYLEECILEIEKSGDTSRETMLFKSKCYANYAIAYSLSKPDLQPVLTAIENDIALKRKYNESDLLLSRSLNTYATVLKEVNPLKALDVYLEIADIKEELISTAQNDIQLREFTASWATTIFNIGLLFKDVELYEIAYNMICYANKFRFETVDYYNRDYCSSVNVQAELELFVHKKQNIEWLINGIESRVDLPPGFSGTLAHTWYVCAYHYYLQNDYSAAIRYINKAVSESKKDGALYDFRQDMRIKLLSGDIRVAQAQLGTFKNSELEAIYQEVIDNIISVYGSDSFYLLKPYRHMLRIIKESEQKGQYNKSYMQLEEKYKFDIKSMEDKISIFLSKHDLQFN